MIKIERSFYLKLLLITTWSSLFLSINLNPIDFLYFNLINKIRIILPFFLIIILIIFKYKEIKISNFLNIYSFSFYIIFFLYIIFTITFRENNILNIFWPLYMFLSFFILHNLTNNKEKKDLFILTILIIATGFIFYMTLGLTDLISSHQYHFYGIMGGKEGYLGFSNPPRSSGLARLALILFFFLIYQYLIKDKKNDYIYLILIASLGTFSLIFQSRTVSFIYITLNIFIILFYFKMFFKDKWLLVFAVILPLLINLSYNYSILLNNNSHKFKKNQIKKETLLVTAFENVILRNHNNLKKNPDKFSSDRFHNWDLAINIIKKNYLKGYGAQADRILIGQSIHNSILYSTLSGGLFSGLSIIFIYISSLILLIKFYLSGAYKLCNDPLVHFSGSVLIIICLRSVLETSFAVFSIDFLIFIIAFLFFNDHLKRYQ